MITVRACFHLCGLGSGNKIIALQGSWASDLHVRILRVLIGLYHRASYGPRIEGLEE